MVWRQRLISLLLLLLLLFFQVAAPAAALPKQNAVYRFHTFN
jgi:hypothetical protein